MKTYRKIYDDLTAYYAQKLQTYGPTPKGVDWNSRAAQEIRFDKLLSICPRKTHFTLNDIGCGYGALYSFLKHRKYQFAYTGYDISPKMIDQARHIFSDSPDCRFFVGKKLFPADYSLASGIFNIKLNHSQSDWEAYVYFMLQKINRASRKGFTFNLLSRHADKEKMKEYLYYADPAQILDFCLTKFSRNVALLHDYNLYELTVRVLHL